MTCLRRSAFRRNTIFVSQHKATNILHKGARPNQIEIENLMLNNIIYSLLMLQRKVIINN